MDQMQRFRASGNDLDALVWLGWLGGLAINPAGEETLLYHAARGGLCSSISWLLAQGADVHRGRPFTAQTPPHSAVIHNKLRAALLLLDGGARVDDQTVNVSDGGEPLCEDTWDGFTALHDAALRGSKVGSIKMCKLLLSRGASLDLRDPEGLDPEAVARHVNKTTTAAFLAEVRAAGGWTGYVAAPRLELLALRRALPALRERGRATPSSVSVHERLFLRKDVPDDAFSHVFSFWRSDRDYKADA